jgi:hypothetical protein
MKTALYRAGALSILCALCTAAVAPGVAYASPTVSGDEVQRETSPVSASLRTDRWSGADRSTAPLPDLDPLDVRWSPLGTVKWVVLGVALATLAGGITLLALDGVNVPCGLPDGVLCPERYTTVTPGAILTAAGASVAVAAGLLFYMDHGRNNPARASVVAPWISRGGGGLAAVLSF